MNNTLFEKIELEPSEKVLKVVRKHWFIIVAELFSVFLLIISPFFILLILIIIPDTIPFDFHLETHLPIFTYGMSLWILLSILVAFMTWTHYYLDLWIVTDRRIILVDQVQFFNRKVSSFRLEKLQDIEVSVNGIIATFLNFGTIQAQTASASENNFKTVGLPQPRELQSLIQKAMDNRLHSLRYVATEIIS